MLRHGFVESAMRALLRLGPIQLITYTLKWLKASGSGDYRLGSGAMGYGADASTLRTSCFERPELRV